MEKRKERHPGVLLIMVELRSKQGTPGKESGKYVLPFSLCHRGCVIFIVPRALVERGGGVGKGIGVAVYEGLSC